MHRLTTRARAERYLSAKVRQARRAPDSPQHVALLRRAAAAHWASRQARANLALVGLAALLLLAAYYR